MSTDIPLAFQLIIENDIKQKNEQLIENLAEEICNVYPRLYTPFKHGDGETEYFPTQYLLRQTPHFSSDLIKGIPDLNSRGIPLIATPQHFEPACVNDHPERLVVEISIVNEQIGVTMHYYKMSELIGEKMPFDIVCQYAYRLTFVFRNSQTGSWEARGHLIPYSIAKQTVELLKSSGPTAAHLLFTLLLADNPVDRELVIKEYEIGPFSQIAARITLESHEE